MIIIDKSTYLSVKCVARTANRIFLLFFFLTVCSVIRAESWNGIVPLKSSRQQVESLLKQKAVDSETVIRYKLKKENVLVTYSTGICGSNDSEWNVPKGVVISVHVFPLIRVHLRDLIFNISLFERSPGPARDLPGMFDYFDTKNGISIHTDASSGKEVVGSVHYFPADAEYYLKCAQTGVSLKSY